MYQCNKTIQRVINYDDVTKENINKHTLNWSQIFDHTYASLIIWGTGSRKTNALHNLTKQQDDDDYSITDKIYWYISNPNKAKYQYLFKNCENNGLKSLKCQKTFIEFWKNMQDVYKNTAEYNSSKIYILP